MKEPEKRTRPATNVESRENQIISKAIDLAEKQIMEGTASSQVIVHFLKLGSTKEKLEKEKLIAENKLLKAKAESLDNIKDTKELYEKALAALTSYGGTSVIDND